MGQLQRLGSLDLSGGFLSVVDVVIDEAQILGHLDIDTRAAWQSTTPITHNSHLHIAIGSITHQWATIISLWSTKNRHTHCVSLYT